MEKITRTVTDKIRLTPEEKEILEKAKVVLEELTKELNGYHSHLEYRGYGISYTDLKGTVDILNDLATEEEPFTIFQE